MIQQEPHTTRELKLMGFVQTQEEQTRTDRHVMIPFTNTDLHGTAELATAPPHDTSCRQAWACLAGWEDGEGMQKHPSATGRTGAAGH